jgi:hypothetical protein
MGEGSDFSGLSVTKNDNAVSGATYSVDGVNNQYVTIDNTANTITIVDFVDSSNNKKPVEQVVSIVVTAKVNGNEVGSVNITLHPDATSNIAGTSAINLEYGNARDE